MPTGYTAGVQEGKVTELKDYVLMCARNFGACIHMRDDDLNNKPKFREVGDYHLKRLIESNKKLEEFYSKTDEDFEKDIQEWFTSANKEREDIKISKNIQKQRYEEMLKKVKEWEIPTDEHFELKKFCIKQLEESIQFDCNFDSSYFKPIPVENIPTIKEWKKSKLNGILENIEYNSIQYKEELKKCEEVNKWITDLYDSL